MKRRRGIESIANSAIGMLGPHHKGTKAQRKVLCISILKA